jgi:hypothetical protein
VPKYTGTGAAGAIAAAALHIASNVAAFLQGYGFIPRAVDGGAEFAKPRYGPIAGF